MRRDRKQSLNRFGQVLFLAVAKLLQVRGIRQAFRADQASGLLQKARRLHVRLLLRLGGLLRERLQAPGHAVDEQALQRIVLVERPDQVLLLGRELIEPDAQIGELPLLDPMHLLLDRQDAVDLACLRAHPSQPRASQPMKPIMKTRSASPIMK